MCLNANPISEGQARQKAERFMLRQANVRVKKAAAANVKARETTAQPFYIFNAADDKGYVIVSGEDRLPSIIGYSTEGSWPEDDSNVPDALKQILDKYKSYVAAIQSGQAVVGMSAKQDDSPRIIVEPLLTSTWGQAYPYNKYAPECTDTSFTNHYPDYNAHFPIGCTTIALGQIINYWKDKGAPLHPQDRSTTVTWENGDDKQTEVMQLSSATTYDYANIPDFIHQTPALSGMSDGEWEVCSDAIGILLRDVAYSLNTNWTPKGGGSADALAAEGAAILGFGMSYDAQTYMSGYFDDKLESQEWWRLIQEDLDNGRPILYGGMAKESPLTGHAFVFDGYDSNHFVHVNWGWNGVCNNWFDINILKTDMYDLNKDNGYDFASNNVMVHNLHPRAAGEVQTLSENKFAMNQFSIGGSQNQWNFCVQDKAQTSYTISPTVCQGQTGLDFDISIVLADSAMNTIKMVKEFDGLMPTIAKDSTIIKPSSIISGKVNIFDDSMPDGIYYVYPLMRGHYKGESTGWFRPMVANCKDNAVRLRLKGNDVATYPEEYDKYFHEPSYAKHVEGLSADIHVFFENDPMNFIADSLYNVNVLLDLNLDCDYIADDLDADCDFSISILNSDNEEVSHVSYPKIKDLIEDVVIFGADFITFVGSLSAEFSLSPGSYTLVVEDEILGIKLEYPLEVKCQPTSINKVVQLPVNANDTYSVNGIRVNDAAKGVVIKGGKVYYIR